MEYPKCSECGKIITVAEEFESLLCLSCLDGGISDDDREDEEAKLFLNLPTSPKVERNDFAVLGVAIAFLLCLCATFLWAGLVKYPEWNVDYVPVVIGLVIALPIALFSNKHSVALGTTAAVFTIFAIINGRYYITQQKIEKQRMEKVSLAVKSIKMAKENDEDLVNNFIVEAINKDGKYKVSADKLTEDNFQYYQEKLFPGYQEFVNKTPEEQRKFIEKQIPSDNLLLLILWTFFGVGIAYFIAAR